MLVKSESLVSNRSSPAARSTAHALQKVLSSAAASSWDGTAVVGHGTEDLELLLEVLSKVHDGSDVATAVAVVGCGPDGDDILVFEVVLMLV